MYAFSILVIKKSKLGGTTFCMNPYHVFMYKK